MTVRDLGRGLDREQKDWRSCLLHGSESQKKAALIIDRGLLLILAVVREMDTVSRVFSDEPVGDLR